MDELQPKSAAETAGDKLAGLGLLACAAVVIIFALLGLAWVLGYAAGVAVNGYRHAAGG
jgi:hypothetical protein